MKILISACLLGTPCRYDGKAKPCEELIKILQKHDLLPICPECDGGLPTPRPPAEICGDLVINNIGKDVTEQYRHGAEIALKTAKEKACSIAILKAKSPSCGYGEIHNGLFDGGLVTGNGITADLLHKNNIKIFNEHDIKQIKDLLKSI